MNLLNSLRRLLGSNELPRPAAPPSTPRNKPNGLARVKLPSDDGTGRYAMQGCFVTTLRQDADGFWLIEPELRFVTRKPMQTASGLVGADRIVAVVSMHDDLLEPIRDGIGDEERDESAVWLPPVPTAGRVTA